MTRFPRAAHSRHPLAGLRPADTPWQPPWRRGPAYDPADDPCGAPPIGEDARRRAVTTLIATMARYLQ